MNKKNEKHLHVKELGGDRSFRVENSNLNGHGHLDIYLKGELIGYLHLMSTDTPRKIEVIAYDRNNYTLVPRKG